MENNQYNEKQLIAINAPEANIIITAHPGSGKTFCIIGAIKKYYNEHPNDHIVAITFTRKGAADLAARIDVPGVEISTIHSWAYRRLQALGVKYEFKIQLLDDNNIKEILRKISNSYGQYYINIFQLFGYVMGNFNIDIDEKIKRIFERIRVKYVKFKRENQLYDFTDLPLYLYDKLIEFGEEINDIDAIYVDEFQDVDPTQTSIFDLVNAKRKVYIGDPKQAIYGFRGAVSDIFNKLDGFTQYSLNINYRSYQRIIDYASTVRDKGIKAISKHEILNCIDVEWYKSSDIICDRGDGGQITIVPWIDEAYLISGEQAKQIDAKALILTLIGSSATQVLCRANKQVKKLQALGIKNCSTVHQAKGLEYDNVILVDFPMDTVEELNICYVALTRAKNNLCVANWESLLAILTSNKEKVDAKLF